VVLFPAPLNSAATIPYFGQDGRSDLLAFSLRPLKFFRELCRPAFSGGEAGYRFLLVC